MRRHSVAVTLSLLGSIFAGATSTAASIEGEPLEPIANAACAAFRADPSDRLVAFSAYEAETISSVAVGGPDVTTLTAAINIERGPAPIYLVLVSYGSVVWRISDPLQRVTKVVVASSHGTKTKPAAGVTGIAPEKIQFTSNECLRYISSDQPDRAAAFRSAVRRVVGREPDVQHMAYGVYRVGLPSGRLTTSDRGRSLAAPVAIDSSTWRLATRFYPGGLLAINPSEVTSPSSVVPYDILPDLMGLGQLVARGDLRLMNQSRLVTPNFRIVRPIPHFPTGMTGAHSVQFVLEEGVPVPSGSLGHSCLVAEQSEETARGASGCGL